MRSCEHTWAGVVVVNLDQWFMYHRRWDRLAGSGLKDNERQHALSSYVLRLISPTACYMQPESI